MKNLFYIFIGGGAGSCLRYLFSLWLNPWFAAFPAGTFAANVLSCLTMGAGLAFLASKDLSLSPEIKLLLLTGFCGGFSTFSTFSNELWGMLLEKNYLNAIYYALGSLLSGFAALWAGWQLGGRLCG